MKTTNGYCHVFSVLILWPNIEMSPMFQEIINTIYHFCSGNTSGSRNLVGKHQWIPGVDGKFLEKAELEESTEVWSWQHKKTKTIQQPVKWTHVKQVQEHLLQGPLANTGQREDVVRQRRYCARRYHARILCGGLDPHIVYLKYYFSTFSAVYER